MRNIGENLRRPLPYVAAYALLVLVYIYSVSVYGFEETLLFGLAVTLLPVPLSAYCHYCIDRKKGTALFKYLLLISGVYAAACFIIVIGEAAVLYPADLVMGMVAALIGGAVVCGLCMAAGAVAERIFSKRRRFVTGRYCVKCDYDLTGNISGRCPECGTPTGAPGPDAFPTRNRPTQRGPADAATTGSTSGTNEHEADVNRGR